MLLSAKLCMSCLLRLQDYRPGNVVIVWQTLRYRQFLPEQVILLRWNMLRRSTFLLLGISLISGCAHTRNEPVPQAPPPGWQGAPAMVAPAPSGCSSCGGSQPVVNAPRYSPPMPAGPAMPAVGVALNTPVSAPAAYGPIQAAFKPTVLPIESARIGTLQIDETPEIPLPPANQQEAQTTSVVK